MQLTPFCLTLTCLRVRPDRAQFFRYDTVTLTCQGPLANASGWTVRRETAEGGVRRCSSGWGFTSSGSTCVIRTTYPTDSGRYWCESVDGEQSNGVNITITDRTVILESPGLPVPDGAAVTLRCRAEMNSTGHVFSFYKDGQHISSSSTGELSIHGASRSDEGLYSCSASGGAASAGSWLAVDGASGATDAQLLPRDVTALPPAAAASLSSSNVTSPPPASSCLMSAVRLTCYLVVGPLYLLSTVLLGLTCRNRKRAADQRAVDRTGSSTVMMEVVV